MKEVAKFYNELSDEYDEMTNFEARLENERPIYKSLVEKYNINTALDAGCGTGLHSILLAQLGVTVTAIDVSEKMIQSTKINADKNKIEIETLQSSFQNLSKNISKKYDAIFCLGNSLSHLLNKKELLKSLKVFKNMLNNHGVLFIQLLNYDRILKHKERIQNIREIKGKTFIRFYDYEDDRIIFNILTIDNNLDQKGYSLSSVPLKPWKSDEIIILLSRIGFSENKLSGSIKLEAYKKHLSHDLFITSLIKK